jgi:FkbM family methyltransferase
MLVIYPFSITDEDQALKNAQWIAELGPYKNHDIVILSDRRCDIGISQAVVDALTPVFKHAQHQIAPADIDGWPQGANYMFGYSTCMIANNPHEWPYFLWLEPDAIPMRKGWLDDLDAAYQRGGKPFMGEKVDLGEKRPDVPIHMSGVGIYPNPIVNHAGECCRAHDVAWDIAAKDQILPRCHFTKLIQHYWKHGTFTSLSGVRPEVVLFHSSKDGSLIDLLRKKAAPGLNQNSVPTEPTSDKSSREEIGTRAVQPSVKILPHNGAWVLEGDTIISDEVERTGRLDFDSLIPYVLKHIRPGDTVVDVGAFIGDHTVAYADAVGKEGEVYAYEPNPTAFKCLVHNTEGMSNVFGFCHALGSTNGLEQMDFSIPNAASNYINHEGKGASIQVRPLDVDAALFHRLDLIKIDVEGYELNVLQGAEKVIEKFHPIMVVEINEIALGRQNTDAQHVISWIVRHGYSVSILHRHKDAIFYDILALPAAKPTESVSSAAAHSPNQPVSATPLVPTVKEEIEWHVGVLKQLSENSPQTKAIVHQKLVYAGLRKPNNTKKHASKTHRTANGQRRPAAEECQT